MRTRDVQMKMIEIDIRDVKAAGKPTSDLEKKLGQLNLYKRLQWVAAGIFVAGILYAGKQYFIVGGLIAKDFWPAYISFALFVLIEVWAYFSGLARYISSSVRNGAVTNKYKLHGDSAQLAERAIAELKKD